MASKESLKNEKEKILFLGTEEFMYIPMLFAKEKKINMIYTIIQQQEVQLLILIRIIILLKVNLC